MPVQTAWMCYPRHEVVRTEEGVDVEGVVPYETNRRLVQLYGNHVRRSDGRHMDGGIVDDNFCHVQWQLLVSQPGSRYRYPQGDFFRRFVKCLAEKFYRERERR